MASAIDPTAPATSIRPVLSAVKTLTLADEFCPLKPSKAFRYQMTSTKAMELGTPAVFAATWLTMMAAMMLPGAAPAVGRAAAATGRVLTVPIFAGTYLAVWSAVGLLVYAVYLPHGAAATGIVAIAAGIYELTPLKHACRERCRHTVRSGAQFGIYCVGSSVGLMAMLVAVDVMSMAWCVVIGALITAQKLLPPRAYVDVPVGLGIVGLGLGMLA